MLEDELKKTPRLTEWEKTFVDDVVDADYWSPKQFGIVERILRTKSTNPNINEMIDRRFSGKFIREARVTHVSENTFFFSGIPHELFESMKDRYPFAYTSSLSGYVIEVTLENRDHLLTLIVECNLHVDAQTLQALESIGIKSAPTLEFDGDDIIFDDGNDSFIANWLGMVTFDEA